MDWLVRDPFVAWQSSPVRDVKPSPVDWSRLATVVLHEECPFSFRCFSPSVASLSMAHRSRLSTKQLRRLSCPASRHTRTCAGFRWATQMVCLPAISKCHDRLLSLALCPDSTILAYTSRTSQFVLVCDARLESESRPATATLLFNQTHPTNFINSNLSNRTSQTRTPLSSSYPHSPFSHGILPHQSSAQQSGPCWCQRQPCDVAGSIRASIDGAIATITCCTKGRPPTGRCP
jgi:hypothetical protein